MECSVVILEIEIDLQMTVAHPPQDLIADISGDRGVNSKHMKTTP